MTGFKMTLGLIAMKMNSLEHVAQSMINVSSEGQFQSLTCLFALTVFAIKKQV